MLSDRLEVGETVLKQWRVLLPGILVSAAAIYMVASRVPLDQLVEALRSALNLQGIFWLVLSFIVMGIGLAARAVRWRVLLSGGLPFWRSFHILNISYLANGILPLRIGEVIRMWLASRETGVGTTGSRGVPIFKSASTIIVERLLDLLAVVLFIAIGLVAAHDAVPNELRATGGLMGVVAVGGFLGLVFFASQRALAQRILAWFVQRIPLLQRVKLADWLNHFLDGLQPLTRPASLANALLWTAISWALSFTYGYMLMLVFYPKGDLVATLLYIAAASFVVAVPAMPGNVGPYELSIALVMAALGYAPDKPAEATVFAFALVVHFVNLAGSAILGVVGYFAEGVSLTQISQGVRGMREADEDNALEVVEHTPPTVSVTPTDTGIRPAE